MLTCMTVLEEKARSLHRDIVTHWIPRALGILKHRIDQANERRWRKEYPFLVIDGTYSILI
ncbi:hypothetical protein Hanom_Chr07g00611391 [Helianthus anomalus]